MIKKKKNNKYTNIFDAQIKILEVNILLRAGCEICISFTMIICIIILLCLISW